MRWSFCSAAVLAVAVAWVPRVHAKAAEACHVVVRKGDTLGAIAQRNGVSEAALIAANPKLAKNPNLLRPGQELDVCAARASAKPKPSQRTAEPAPGRRCGRSGHVMLHTVESGDTLGGLADRYEVTEAELKKRNPELAKRPDRLQVGDTLEVCVGDAVTRKSKHCNGESPLHHHEVVPGEHLGQIAGRYGVRRRDLVRLNASLKENPNLLRVGQRLRVCPLIPPRERTRMSHTVERGETVGSIAKRYGLSPGELVRYQQGALADPNALRTGQQLVVWVDGDLVRGFPGVEDDDRGVLKGGLQLPPGRHYVIKTSAHAWGTAKTIRLVQSAIDAYQRARPGGPKVHVGDISRRSGGHFPPHLSHQHGRDIDVGYVLMGELKDEIRFRSANANNLDIGRSWALIKAFIDTDEVQYVFVDYHLQELMYEHAKTHGFSEDLLDELFQYPRGRGRTHGLIRHWKGHMNHFHVRFRR